MDSRSELIIITGSSGLLGSATVRRLAEKRQLVGFDRAGDPHPPPEAECVCVDVTSDASMQAGLHRVRYGYGDRIASVVHLAAYYDFSGKPSSNYEEVTVRGTERLLRGLQDFSVEQFIFSSTMLVHAPCEPGERINEDWPLDPRWDYPESKTRTEEVIRGTRGEIPVVLLHIAGVYDELCHSIPLAHQIQRIYERLLSVLLGLWMMLAPWILGTDGSAAQSNQVTGALVITVSIILMAKVVRVVRFLNVLLGLWLIASPWLFDGASLGATWNNVVMGLAVVLLSIPRGKIREQYGGWYKYIV